MVEHPPGGGAPSRSWVPCQMMEHPPGDREYDHQSSSSMLMAWRGEGCGGRPGELSPKFNNWVLLFKVLAHFSVTNCSVKAVFTSRGICFA